MSGFSRIFFILVIVAFAVALVKMSAGMDALVSWAR